MPRIFTQEQLGKDRVNGFYETPLKTVEYICNNVLSSYRKGMKILDPAVGDGIFLSALHQAGISHDDLYGFDIDEQKVDALRKKFPNVRVFDATYPFPETYDFIVGNPPYNGDESHYVRENRKRLKEQFKEIDAKNTYSMITYRAINALRENGIFSMILSDSFLTNSYYKSFRLFLLRNTQMHELLLAPWKLFHGRSADVRTCILTATKKMEGETISSKRTSMPPIRLVDRVHTEDDYLHPQRVEYIPQDEFTHYPNGAFLIGVSPQIRDMYLHPSARLGDIVMGGTGISTGNDKRFLRRREEVQNNKQWVPYFKNGARRAYYYRPEFFIERNYEKYQTSVANYLVRNEKFFFKEGITCSSVGVRFSAAYLPKNCLFGVNANFFFRDRETLFYTLGLLNTKLAWYFSRKVLIRTNHISANYLRLLPYQEPPAAEKKKIALTVAEIVNKLRTRPGFDFSAIQAKLDKKFYQIFQLTPATIKDIEEFCSNFYEAI